MDEVLDKVGDGLANAFLMAWESGKTQAPL
jgi:hypothetical protein